MLQFRDQLCILISGLVTFFNTTNPYLDHGEPDIEALLPPFYHGGPYDHDHRDHLNANGHHEDLPPIIHPHGLEALSAAALFYPPEAQMVPRPASNQGAQADDSLDQASSTLRKELQAFASRERRSPGRNTEPASDKAPIKDAQIDPSLTSTGPNRSVPLHDETDVTQEDEQGRQQDKVVDSEEKAAFLLRHFSESPGKWFVDEH